MEKVLLVKVDYFPKCYEGKHFLSPYNHPKIGQKVLILRVPDYPISRFHDKIGHQESFTVLSGCPIKNC